MTMDKPVQQIDANMAESGAAASGRARLRAETLAEILHNNPILDAYLLNYVANFYVGPLLKVVDARQGLTRPEWIVIFCLSQRDGLNAQQISDVTGRAKSSVSHAIKLLQKKKLLHRTTDPVDGRRQVLKLTPAGRAAYSDLVTYFVEREEAMLACLTTAERRILRKLMTKLTDNMDDWTESY